MSLKKVLTLSAASVAMLSSLASFAGGPDVVSAAPACQACVVGFVPYLYIGASAGWAYSNWDNFITGGNNFTYFNTSADKDGFTFGGKLGYQFTDHFGIEGGAFMLPDSDQSVTHSVSSTKSNTINGEIDSWFAYGAATLRAAIPFNPLVHVTGKVGGVYREVDHDGDLYANVQNGSYGTVLFGASVDYDLAAYHLPLLVGVDYYFIPGTDRGFFSSSPSVDTSNLVNVNSAPAAQVVVGTLSVRLAV